MAREVILPSGAKLEITVAPFRISKALYQAMADEAKALKLDPAAEVDVNFWKDLFCIGVASPAIEDKIWACLDRATYNGLKITQETFEPIEARDDYLTACFEVAQDNVRPFTKSLFVRYSVLFQGLLSTLASRSEKTIS